MEINALELVRQRTREAHAHLEQRMHVDRIMDRTLQPAHLIQLLQVNHHFLEAVERNALRYPDLSPFVVARAGWALKDLQAMGASELPPTSELDAWDLDAMRGALYVALGSLLGGATIAQKIQGLPGLPSHQSFYAMDRQAMGTWRDFLSHLQTLHTEAQREGLVRGAVRTFTIAADACTLAATSAAQA